MIEIVYNKEKEAAVGNEEYFSIPRNIRQIGQAPTESKIYIEDYAYTFLTSEGKGPDAKGRAAILLGKCNWKKGVSYIFIKSALFMENLEVSGENISLSDTVWGSIYEEMKEYFPGQEVVGWYLDLPGNAMKITDMIYRTHLNHFGGNDKVLFLAEPQEQEEAFFLYRNGHLEQQRGYYIYYERNEAMQEYMVAKNPKDSIDATGKVQDRAVKDFRKIIAKKSESKETKRTNQFLYVASTGIVVLSLAMGVNFIGQRMNPERSIEESQSETVSGEVNPEDILASLSATPEADGKAQGPVSEQPGAETPADKDTPGKTQASAEADTSGKTQDPAQSEKENSGVNQTSKGQDTSGNNQASEESAAPAGNGTEPTPAPAPTGIMDEVVSGEQQTLSPGGTGIGSNYTVREGDTLSSISERYYGSIGKVTEICKMNSMTEVDIIYPGQTILLP